MRRGFTAILIIGIIMVAGGSVFYKYSNPKQTDQQPSGKSNEPAVRDETQNKSKKTTTPNNTSAWIYFSSELYEYSLKYPNNYKIIPGNKNVFQASSPDYKEEEGIVTAGAITQVIASDFGNSFEDAWGDIDKKLDNLDIKVLSKESVLIKGEDAYKFKLKNTDGTTEFRYLTYKNNLSYKISIVIAQRSAIDIDSYEQILDDIITTFNF